MRKGREEDKAAWGEEDKAVWQREREEMQQQVNRLREEVLAASNANAWLSKNIICQARPATQAQQQ